MNILFYFCFYTSCHLLQQLTTVKQIQQFLSRRVQQLLMFCSFRIFGRNTCKVCEPYGALPPTWNGSHEALAWSRRAASFRSSQIFHRSSVSQAYKIVHGFTSSAHSLADFLHYNFKGITSDFKKAWKGPFFFFNLPVAVQIKQGFQLSSCRCLVLTISHKCPALI